MQLGIQKQLLVHKSTKPVRVAKFQFPVELIGPNCTRKTAVVNWNSVFQEGIFVSGFMNIYYLGRVGHVGGALLLLTTALKMKETGVDLRKRDPIGIERPSAHIQQDTKPNSKHPQRVCSSLLFSLTHAPRWNSNNDCFPPGRFCIVRFSRIFPRPTIKVEHLSLSVNRVTSLSFSVYWKSI